MHHVLVRIKSIFFLLGLFPPLRVMLGYRAGLYLPLRYILEKGLVVTPERAPYHGAFCGDLTGHNNL